MSSLANIARIILSASVIFALAVINGCTAVDSFTRAFLDSNTNQQEDDNPVITLTKSCDTNNAAACYALGKMYYIGNWTEVDLYTAEDLFHKSCGLQYDKACLTLAEMYYNGDNVIERDLIKAQDFYQKSCLLNNAEGCYKLGKLYYDKEITDTELGINSIISLFDKSCSLEYGEACVKLGQMYYTGNGVERDQLKAKIIFQKACDFNFNAACKALASMTGDSNKAQSSKTQSTSTTNTGTSNRPDILQNCNSNTPQQCVILAMNYYHGDGVAKNVGTTIKLLQKGCNLNHGPSCAMLGVLYGKGAAGGKHNLAITKSLLQRGCDLNVGTACDNLGIQYFDFDRSKTNNSNDIATAFKLFQKGCKLNAGHSCFMLGFMYHHGIGVKRDPVARDELLQKGCNLNSKLSCRLLGVIYYGGDGNGTKSDLNRAEVLLKKACDLDEGASCSYLAGVYSAKASEQASDTNADTIATATVIANGRLLKKACNLNDGISCYMLGEYHITFDRNLVLAKNAFQKGCSLGDKESCVALNQLSDQIQSITTTEEIKRQQKLVYQQQKAAQLEADLETIRNLVINN